MYGSFHATIIRNLKVVARLKQGQKLNTRLHHYSIDEHTTMSVKSLYRWINGESREQTVDSLTQLIESIVRQNGLPKEESNRLIRQLSEAYIGIVNLSITYKDDNTTCAGLEYILESIDNFINRHGAHLMDTLPHASYVLFRKEEQINDNGDGDDEEESGESDNKSKED